MSIQYCKKCLFPDSKPDLYFDSEGVCDACRTAERKHGSDDSSIDWDNRGALFDDIIEEEGSPGDTHQIYGDNRKLLELIGFKPAFDIETGIQNFVQWAKEYY